MNKGAFLTLFEGNSDLHKAAGQWWKDVENCDHPYSKLWFHHWQQETRAHPEIAVAFRYAVDLGFHKAASGELACEIFERLYRACLDGHAPKEIMGLFSGGVVNRKNLSGQSTTLIGIDLPENALDLDVSEAVKRKIEDKNKRGELAITWMTPLEDVPGELTQDAVNIDSLRDKLGLPHLRNQDVIVCLLWLAEIMANTRIPTILDGQWAFWRPAPENEEWGRTMALATADIGLREGVIGGEQHDWEIAGDKDSPFRWQLAHSYDPGPDGRYPELCESLIEKIYS